ncbi:hypothetical protein F511_30721 [Dorcoceras hygrometricum]|uniref:Uncharacterized protein n=1 Tax=Dorcoceras hygrometricum TaxID=472368 RepID=A0A2Z7CU11_9LAMI|nr:hypothetical protein F511_30721 [Dorcoceras hygrometricum]
MITRKVYHTVFRSHLNSLAKVSKSLVPFLARTIQSTQISSTTQINSGLRIRPCTGNILEHSNYLGNADQLATQNNLGFSTQLTMVNLVHGINSAHGSQHILRGTTQLTATQLTGVNSAYDGQLGLGRSIHLRTVNTAWDGQNSLERSTQLRTVNSAYAQRMEIVYAQEGKIVYAQGRKTAYAQRRKNSLRSRKEKQFTLKKGKTSYAQEGKTAYDQGRKNNLCSKKEKQLTLKEGITAYVYRLRLKREKSLRLVAIETWLRQSPIHVQPLAFFLDINSP